MLQYCTTPTRGHGHAHTPASACSQAHRAKPNPSERKETRGRDGVPEHEQTSTDGSKAPLGWQVKCCHSDARKSLHFSSRVLVAIPGGDASSLHPELPGSEIASCPVLMLKLIPEAEQA